LPGSLSWYIQCKWKEKNNISWLHIWKVVKLFNLRLHH
jgi:hypothetical protein